MKHLPCGVKLKQRRLRVIERLEAQLKSGVKTAKDMEIVKMDGSPSNVIATLPLTEGDKQRITNELITLKTRI